MRNTFSTLAIGSILLAGGPAAAQWPSHADRDVPRNPDGSVDIDAPAPRTEWGTPDFTGIWEILPGAIGGGTEAREPGEPQLPEQDPGDPPYATFFDIGEYIEGGAPFQDWARELRAERMERNQQDNPDAHCLPMGHMQFHLHPQPREIVQTEDVLLILYEGNAGVRQIYLDGRRSPDNDPLPWWYGYSWGRWEGDELVVTTTQMKDTWLDVFGSPFTVDGTIIERFRRPSFGRMEIDITIDDPTAYTEPFTVRVEHTILVDTSLIEFICIENEQSIEYYD
ncbi:MAG TPA: hypothetical protein VMR74_13440 [Gammaproteobacteria bacterium]|nr:hypothetical protein [Gammaproteobacteria bacterium]